MRSAPSDHRAARLGEQLVARGVIDHDAVSAALEEQERTGGRLGDILLAHGAVDGAALSVALAHQYDLPSFVREHEAVPALPRAVAHELRAAVLAGPSGGVPAEGRVLVAVTDLAVVGSVAAALGRAVAPRLTDERTMDRLLAGAYAHDDGTGARALLPRELVAAAPEPLLLRALSVAVVGFVLAGLLTGSAWLVWLALAPALAGTAAIAARLRARGETMAPGEEPDHELPSQTVLIALSRERPRTLARLRLALDGLDYPAHKLQGLAVVPASDHATRARLRRHPLPAWVTVVEAPPSAGRDRRGLLLFGLRQARGELLTVVRPGVPVLPDLLRRAAADEEHGGRDLRRLAARLLRQAEAPTAAELAIGGLDARGELPHFRTADLRAAFGVAEDADAGDRAVVAHSGARPFLVAVMGASQKRTFAALVALWLGALAFFWSWWLRSDHVVTPLGMVINTLMLVWGLMLPGLFFVHLARMRRPNPALELPRLRVAMVVTKAPSEPWEVVRGTLRAMLRQRMPYAYDVWLADERADAETLAWCQANGVRVSTREGVAEYHRSEWPRRTRSKEGNLAYFYDHWGYRDYDVVAQLDADHRPAPTYLREIVRAFADPRVGYVAAPSVCDANAGESWAARGRLYKEATFHGPQQAGGHHAIPPTCIGSHYAVRTQALREIGGVGPELAEDFSTSLMMNAFGWRGVFALDAEAHGDGPDTFADFITQEFQWARSLSNVMLEHTRRYWPGLARGPKLKLGFCEVWYPLYALHMLVASIFPVWALALRSPWASVRLVDFFAHVFVVSAVLLVALAWVRRQGWLRPADAPLLSWETTLFLFTRWPWVLWGVAHSWAAWLLGRRFGFKVTPKGVAEAQPLVLKAVVPYLLIAAACAVTAIAQDDPGPAVGYFYFCLLNALIYLAVTVAVIALHLHESHELRPRGLVKLALAPAIATAGVGALVVAAFVLRGATAAQALLSERMWSAIADTLAAVPARLSDGATPWLVLFAAAVVLVNWMAVARLAQRRLPGEA
jgi:cellulose synthase/poly-beta-1,6-N-acetylglucosamine synthase-like glycosyltransferase